MFATIKNFQINFNALNEGNIYSSGDLITGHISFELAKECAINSITLTLKGKANVSWSTGTGKRRRRVTAKVKYFTVKNVIMTSGEAAVQSKFPPGKHVYQFTCPIPEGDFPSSFKGAFGQILYTLLVGFDRPWHITKTFATQLNYATRPNPRWDVMAPLSGTNTMTVCCLWCASGPISMTVRLDRNTFLPGEEVTVTCEIDNASSRTATTRALLLQKQVFYTLNRVSKRIWEQRLASKAGDVVGPHSSDVHSELTLTVPSDVPLTIDNCAIVDVGYTIEVRLSVKYSPDLTVICPIIICNSQYNVAQPI